MVVGAIATGTEVLVIGGGPAGYSAALRAAHLGREVTLVEAAEVGGVCLNQGCIPSKVLVEAAHKHQAALAAQAWGLGRFTPHIDVPRLRRQQEAVVTQLRGGVHHLLKKAGVTLLEGEAVFTAQDRVQVNGRGEPQNLQFEDVILATGAGGRPLWAGEPWEVGEGPLVLEAAAQQEGYALELACAYAQLGWAVTLAGVDPDRLPLDRALLGLAKRRWRDIGLAFATPATPPPALRLPPPAPRTQGLGLEQVGLAQILDAATGAVRVDARQQTAHPHIWAAGNVTGGPYAAHLALRQGSVAAEALSGRPAAFDQAAVPFALFTDPELAWVGLAPEAAGSAAEVVRFPLAASGRAQQRGEAFGQGLLVVDRASGVLLGAQLCGQGAAELIYPLALALELGALAEDVALSLPPHPTLSEIPMELAWAALGLPVHVPHQSG